jgi:hypothetical protein
MNALLFASLAANLVALIALMVLLVGRETDRELVGNRNCEIENLKDLLAERDVDLALTREMNGSLLAEVTEFRAAKAKRLANLSRGTPKPKIAA